jgi:putative heme iron utilization protein
MGTVTPVPQEERLQVSKGYLAWHADASSWVDFGDFGFYRMDLTDTYLVAGFGVMGWVSAEDYYRAAVDPLADMAATILQHMNADHSEALLLMAQHFGACAADTARVTMVDRLGLHLQVTTTDTRHGLRLPFLREVRNAEEVRKVLTEMTQQARAAAMRG